MNTAILEGAPTAQGEALAAPLLQFDPESRERQWNRAGREAAWRRFQELPAPARNDERWRFSSLKPLELSSVGAPLFVSDADARALTARSEGTAPRAGRMIFANDELVAHEEGNGLVGPLQRGVIWLPLARAATEHPELFGKYFMREPAVLGGEKFAALHEAWIANGMFLYVPKGVEIELPLETFYWLHGDGACCFPHTLIVAEENSRVTVIDYLQSSAPDARGFACGVNDLWLGTGAKVTYVNIQRWSNRTSAIQMNSTIVGRDASALALNAHFGGGYVRTESVSHLRAPGGRSDMLAFAVAEDEREVDQRTLQIHESPNTASDLLYKNALDGKAHTIFSGLIRVAPGAHFTDAYQKVRNLLLSDESVADSAPGLEIEADNVRCTHGATSGQVEEEELFYLLSRGIPRQVAQRLIVFGFLNEVIERVRNESVEEELRSLLREKYRI